MNCLIVGCGYLGQQAASQWNAAGARVYAITRSETKAVQLAKQSIQPIVVDWYQENSWPTLPQVDRLLVSVSHARVPGIVPIDTHVSGLKNLLDRLVHVPDRIAYLSTTGVYAACEDGRWIDENSPVAPNRPGSVAALAAEQWLAANIPDTRLSILRAAGIYGPGRIPRLDALRSREPIEVDPESFLNLIHVEDLARIVDALLRHPSASGIYNVADGQPVLRRDYYQFIAKTIGSAFPEFRKPAIDSESSSPVVRARGEGNKRIAIGRVSSALQYRFRFPDYVAGLTPLLMIHKSV